METKTIKTLADVPTDVIQGMLWALTGLNALEEREASLREPKINDFKEGPDAGFPE